MQTKHQIEQLLAAAGVSPKKHLGQHFLIDLNLMRLLVESADISKTDIVLEVGCGTGSLTDALAQRAGRVIAVEVDDTLAEIAKAELATYKNIEIINADILQNKSTINPVVVDALKLARKKYKGRILLVANLPYNVASPVMVNLLAGPAAADSMSVTIQKQVAERMTAAPGSPAKTSCRNYGTLSIYLAAAGDVKILRTLKPTVFWPQPQVDSAMVGFVRSKDKIKQIRNMKMLSEVVNLFLCHRRKMLRVCPKFARGRLAQIADWPDIFRRCSIDPTRRPEQLSPQDYVTLANHLYGCLRRK
jgi:16S rRNA (adenine1518-N6/adenine1519-N6)-dimethyltransferase